MKTFLQKIKLIVPAVTAFMVPVSVKAAVSGDDVEKWGLGMFTSGSLADIISKVVSSLLVIAGIIAVGYFIAGGISYLTAGGDAEKAGTGKNTIVHAIIGIVIIVAAYLIFNFVRVGLGVDYTIREAW